LTGKENPSSGLGKTIALVPNAFSHGTEFALRNIQVVLESNTCMFRTFVLLKFCYKTLHDTPTPWKLWITSLLPFPISHGLNSSFLGKNIYKHMDTLRAITQCTVRNGQSTFFWLDRWLLPEPLSNIFPAIFSHHQNQHTLVGDIMQVGVQNALRNRLTLTTSLELSSLLPLLQAFQLKKLVESRTMLDGKPFSTRGIFIPT
jgi:hypothetical protein